MRLTGCYNKRMRWIVVSLAALGFQIFSFSSANACAPSAWQVDSGLPDCIRLTNDPNDEYAFYVDNECSDALTLAQRDCDRCPSPLNIEPNGQAEMNLPHTKNVWVTYDYELGDSNGSVHFNYEQNACSSTDSDGCTFAPPYAHDWSRCGSLLLVTGAILWGSRRRYRTRP